MLASHDIKIHGIWTFAVRDATTGAIRRVFRKKNLIPTVGRAAIANHLTASSPSPSTLRANYTALGSGTNAPANGDTTLQTEVIRKQTGSATNANNVAYITAFYTASEGVGTHREAGIFIAGTATADSGTLLSRIAINITKGATETLTIDTTITIS